MKRHLSAALLVAGILVIPAMAWAQESTPQAGWWTTLPAALAPDVGDGLLVQGGPNAENPLAYAAISASLPDGATPSALVLELAEGAPSTPAATLAVCPLTESFQPAQGGTSEEAPAFDCSAKSTASPSEDGTSYRFDLSALAGDDGVAVAILPTTATDRVVFAAPSGSAIESSGGSDSGLGGSDDFGGFSDTSSSFDTGSGATAGSSFSTGSSFDTGSSSSFDVPGLSAPVGPDAPSIGDAAGSAAAGNAGASDAGAPQALAAQAASSSDDGRSFAPFVLAALLLTVAALWGLAGRSAATGAELA